MKTYDIAAYIWPAYTGKEPRTRIFWPEGIGEWQTVRQRHDKPAHGYTWHRTPLWGYEDEADPSVMEKQIREATRHGVNVFIYDWYWYDDRPFLEQCLNEGFLGAENNTDMRFYLMWANHNANYTWDRRISGRVNADVWRGEVTDEQFTRICRRWIDRYFSRPNYYTIDEKPVVAIYDLQNFIVGLGGIEAARAALDRLRDMAKGSGLPGVHVQLIKWGDAPINLSGVDGGAIAVSPELVERLGFDSLTNYQYVHFTDVSRDYEALLPDVVKEWNAVHQAFSIPYFPHVSIGWDNNPRFLDFRPDITTNNPPAQVKRALELARAFSDEHNTVPLITVNSWNEWTESSYLLPDNVNGYGYLEAVRDVFLQKP